MDHVPQPHFLFLKELTAKGINGDVLGGREERDENGQKADQR